MLNHRLIATAAILAIGLVGCATTNQYRPAPGEKPKSCCQAFSALPLSQPLFHSQSVALLPSSPHFDFGDGLAPFLDFSIASGSVRVIELWMKQSAPAQGGVESDTLYFVSPKVYFFAADGAALTTTPPGAAYLKALDQWGNYVLTFSVVVPSSATRIIVTSDLRAVGLNGESFGYKASMSFYAPIIPGGITIPLTGESRQRKYIYSPYGSIIVHAYGAPINPAIPQPKARGTTSAHIARSAA